MNANPRIQGWDEARLYKDFASPKTVLASTLCLSLNFMSQSQLYVSVSHQKSSHQDQNQEY